MGRDLTANIEPMRRNPSTVVVLAGSAPGEVLTAIGQSMNVALIKPEDPADSASNGMPGGRRGVAAGRAIHVAICAGARRPAGSGGRELPGDVGRVAAAGSG